MNNGGGGSGGGLLDLSGFRNDSSWDFTAFVRLYAQYLAERLMMGKLHHQYRTKLPTSGSSPEDQVVLVTVLLEKIKQWQRLLDRVVATKPTGAAMKNRTVQNSVHLVDLESFEMYRDISDVERP